MIYKQNIYANTDSTKASIEMFKMAGVSYEQFKLKNKIIKITL